MAGVSKQRIEQVRKRLGIAVSPEATWFIVGQDDLHFAYRFQVKGRLYNFGTARAPQAWVEVIGVAVQQNVIIFKGSVSCLGPLEPDAYRDFEAEGAFAAPKVYLLTRIDLIGRLSTPTGNCP